MNLLRPLAALALCPALLAPFALGCGKSSGDAPAIPASSDPEGKDMVEGAIVAAQESSGGYRLYKVTHVDDYPDPIGYEFDMIAYEPKGTSLEDAARLWKQGAVKVALEHLQVRLVHFGPRDHRVIAFEKVTDAERKRVEASRAQPGPPPSAPPPSRQ